VVMMLVAAAIPRAPETIGAGRRYIASASTKEVVMLIKPRTIERRDDTARPTIPSPRSDGDFAGWGPRLRY